MDSTILKTLGLPLTHTRSWLAELDSWLGVTRAKQTSTYAAVAAALGPHIWPQRYPRIEDAITIMNQGKHSAVKALYARLLKVCSNESRAIRADVWSDDMETANS